ncbi:AAA family ATPase [Faecalibacillus intestinalis]|uniref:AAA family ATPase n=1 Tax=Faecalibacillus intestinalis TaxID=1982626 RepID=UPI0039995BF2
MIIERKEYLNKLITWKDKQWIKIVTGVRRCGKSVLLKMYQDYLKNNGVKESQIVAINFEDLDYEELTNYKKLNIFYNIVDSDDLDSQGKNIFLNKDIWWIFIFYKCKYLSQGINKNMEDFIVKYMSTILSNKQSEQSKLEICKFFLEYNGEKFINWELDKKMFFKNIKFKTFDRTIFNNKQENETFDIFDY